MFHSNPYYYWSLMSVVMYVGIVCSVLVLMIMFTDTVCRFTVFLLVELLCPLIVVFTIQAQQLAPIMTKMMWRIFCQEECDEFSR